MKAFLFIVSVLFSQSCFAQYYSQIGQDQFVNEYFFKDLKEGVFVDIGAHNGVTYSNTYFFETELGWTGLCVEPLPDRFTELQANRDCVCVNGCVSDFEGESQLLKVSSPSVNTEMLSGLINKYDPRHRERVDIEISRGGGSYTQIPTKCYLLNDLLEDNHITHINLLSLDTEGGELDILSSIDFSRYTIDVIVVEDNYQDPRFISFLEEKGYHCVSRLEFDLVFARKELLGIN